MYVMEGRYGMYVMVVIMIIMGRWALGPGHEQPVKRIF